LKGRVIANKEGAIGYHYMYFQDFINSITRLAVGQYFLEAPSPYAIYNPPRLRRYSLC